MDSHFHGNDIRSNEIAALSSKVHNDRSLSKDNKCRGVLQCAYYYQYLLTNGENDK